MDLFREDIDFISDSKAFMLLKEISKKLGKDFLLDSVSKEASESRAHWSESSQCYFKHHIIAEAAMKTAYPYKTQEEETTILYLNAIPKYAVNCHSSLPFGNEHIFEVLKKKKKSRSEIKECNTLVEKKVAEFCKKLSEYSSRSSMGVGKRAFALALQCLTSKADILDFESETVRPQKVALREMLCTYYLELTEGLTILKRLLNLFERKFNFQLNLAEMFYLDSQCLRLKIRIIELRAMDLTYSSGVLPALMRISAGLAVKQERLMDERDEQLCALEAYQVLGTQYDTLVEEYRQLAEKVTQQKWAIDALSSRQNP